MFVVPKLIYAFPVNDTRKINEEKQSIFSSVFPTIANQLCQVHNFQFVGGIISPYQVVGIPME